MVTKTFALDEFDLDVPRETTASDDANIETASD